MSDPSPRAEPTIPADRLDPAFGPRLRRFDVAKLEARPDVAYALTDDLRLAYVNAAWPRFAEENGDPTVPARWPLGRSLAEALPEPLRAYYLDGFETCRRSGETWSHDYECSSPTLFRLFHQTVYPLEGSGFLVVNALRDERPLDAPDHAPERTRFEDADGLITMCSHCRCVRAVDDRWRRVSAWVERMPRNVSHGLCEPCLDWFYGDA